jgi:CheY-like chemotaxis protein
MILLDVDMPGKDGGEVARELQSDPALSQKPVLFFTSLISHREAGTHEVERGGMLFLAKPVDPAVLIETVARLLGKDAVLAE